ncbi:MAG: hypothetical protein RLZZ387_3995 [Chloroflexota bacterium]|jgi:alpha-mannosidase
MVGNAHLDPVWLWDWREGYQAAKATFRSALDRMAETPEFIFTSSQAAIYEWIEQNEPAMFEEIRRRVAEGRWRIVGGWWLQPDCNLPSGESFARQGLLGQRYFRSRFGVVARVGYNVDSFGHHAMLPQILRRSGMDSYVFMRPEPNECGLPGRVFWWESDDGSRVLTYRIPFEYGTWGKDLERYVRRCASELRPPFDELMLFYGVGNHGGGPTRVNLESIQRMMADADLPALTFSSPEQFLDAARARDLPFPTVHDELQHHASGCYAVHSGIKRWNRQAESLLLTAEKWSAVALRTVGQPYPDMSQAWKNALFNQFHDILGGTSIEQTYEDARDMHGEVMSVAGRGLNHAVQSLAWRIGIPQQDGVTPVVVFNPHAWPVRANVEVELSDLKETERLLDDQGRELPLQFIEPSAIVSGWRKRVSFTADLPPLGWRTYRVVPGAEEGAGGSEGLAASDTTLDNGRLRLTLNPKTGCVTSLLDQRCGVEVFLGPAAEPAVFDDPSDTWSHGVYQYTERAGAFAATSVRVVESGPVRATIRVESAYGTSRLTQDFTMYADMDRIDVRVTVDWHERHKLLKLLFPLNQNFQRAAYEIPFGVIERPCNGEEEPGQSWFDLSGIARGAETAYGLSILNDGKYSFSVRGRTMGLTVLRSPIYAHHAPTQPQPGAHYSYIDQGVQRFSYSLLPHQGSWEGAGTVRQAAELNQRPTVLIETFHDGTLPQAASFLAVEPDTIVVTALKRAEDGDDLVLRAYETTRGAARATFRLPQWGRVFSADFGPAAIKTFRIPADPAQAVTETSMVEMDDL